MEMELDHTRWHHYEFFDIIAKGGQMCSCYVCLEYFIPIIYSVWNIFLEYIHNVIPKNVTIRSFECGSCLPLPLGIYIYAFGV
jgi:hypothetical protein